VGASLPAAVGPQPRLLIRFNPPAAEHQLALKLSKEFRG
jgi:hypothetical protein